MAIRDEVFVDIITETKKSVKSMLKFAAAITGAIMTVRKIHKVMNDLEAVYKIQGEAQTLFEAALKATGTAAEVSAKKIYALAASLQSVTLFGDEATITASALLQSLSSLSQEGLEQIIPLLQDFSTGMKIDLQTAASLVGKTLGSTTNALSRYGIVIDATLPKEEKLIALTESLESKFGGMSEALGATAIATKEQLGFAISDLKEQMGRAIAVGMRPFREWLTRIVVESTKVKEAINDMVDLLDRGDRFEMVDRIGDIQKAIEILEKKRDKPITFFTKKQAQLLKDLKAELELISLQYEKLNEEKLKKAYVDAALAKVLKEEEELQKKLIEGLFIYNTALENTLTEQEKQRRAFQATIDELVEYQDALKEAGKWSGEHAEEVQTLINKIVGLRDAVEDVKKELTGWDVGIWGGIGIPSGIIMQGTEIAETEKEIYELSLLQLKNISDRKEMMRGLGQAALEYLGIEKEINEQRRIGNAFVDKYDEIFTEIIKKEIDLSYALASSIGDIASAFGAMFVSQEKGIEKVLESIKNMIATTLEALGKQYLIEAIKLAIPPIPLLGAPAMFAIAGGALAAAGAVRAMGEGGVVTKPTIALIGERGPEEVRPLGKGGGGNVYITVEGSILAERDLEGISLMGQKRLARGY